MSEVELERMIIRLVGDGSSYQAMLVQAQEQSKVAASQIQKTGQQIEGVANSIKGFGREAVSVLESIGATAFLKSAFDSFVKMEQGMTRLRVSIEASGASVSTAMADYNAFAQTVERNTLTTKAATLQMITYAETMGFSGEAAKRLTTNAIALAGATGEDAQSMLRVAVAMEQGNLGLVRRALHLHHLHDETQLMNEIQRRMEVGLRQAGEAVNTTGGQLEKLGMEVARITKQFGEVVAQGVRPVIAGLREVVSWFQGLDPQIKTIIVTTASLVAGIVAIGPALRMVMGLAGTFLTPITVAVTAAGAIIGSLINQVGGFEPAWERVKAAAIAAWEWMDPVLKALQGFFEAAYEAASSAWQGIEDFVAEVWDNIASTAGVSWQDVRSFIVDAILFAEFTLRNFKQTADWAWTSIKYGLSVAVDFMKDSLIFFAATAAATARGTIAFFEAAWRNIRGIVTGESVNMADAVSREFERAFGEIAAALGAGESAATRRLGQELTAQTEAMRTAFNAFRQQKLEAFGPPSAIEIAHQERVANELGIAIGSNLNRGLKQELGKFDAALRGSAEAMSRIIEYKDKIGITLQHIGGAIARPAAVGNIPAVGAGGAGVGVPTVGGTVVPPQQIDTRPLLLRIATAVEKANILREAAVARLQAAGGGGAPGDVADALEW